MSTVTVYELEKESVPVTNIKDEHLLQLFKLQAGGKIPNEAIGGVLKAVAANPELTVDKAASFIAVAFATMSA